MNYLASPPLVVAYAIAGSVDIDLTTEPLGIGQRWQAGLPQGHLAKQQGDRRPDREDRRPGAVRARTMPTCSRATRAGTRSLRPTGDLPLGCGLDLHQEPALLRWHEHGGRAHRRHHGARVLGCSATRSPPTTSRLPATSRVLARRPFLQARGVQKADFNSYGSRRGNDDVMVRGTFANIRIKNLMLGGEEGGNTLH
jgi:aconitate hydratase